MGDLAERLTKADTDIHLKRTRSWWCGGGGLTSDEAFDLSILIRRARNELELLESANRELTAELEAEREKSERFRIAFLSACEAIQHAESTTDSFCAECGRDKKPDGNCPSCPPVASDECPVCLNELQADGSCSWCPVPF